MKHEKRRGTVKLLLPALALALLAVLSVTATLAWFTDSPTGAINTLVVGGVDAKIKEGEPWDWDGTSPTPTPPDITPGGVVAKSPKVVNYGSLPVYARILVAGGTEQFLFSTEKAKPAEDSTTWVEFEELHTGEAPPVWQLEADGYWYYKGSLEPDDKGILEPGDETTPLFNWVKLTLKENFNGDAENLDLIVYAETVQTIDYKTGEPFEGGAQEAFAALNTPQGGDDNDA